MIVLQSTDTLRIVCAAATTLPLQVWASWADDGTAPTLGRGSAQTNDTSSVDIVSAPGAGNTRVVRTVLITNPNTVAVTVTISAYDGVASRTLGVHAIQPNGTLVYTDGWQSPDLSGVGLPDYSTALDRSILTLVNGVPTWKSGLAGPAGDGDVYLWLERMVAANRAKGVSAFSFELIAAPTTSAHLGGARAPDGRVICWGSSAIYSRAFNPVTNVYDDILDFSNNYGGCPMADGRIFVAGATSIVYDPVDNAIDLTVPYNDGQPYTACPLADGRVLVPSIGTTQTKIYDPESNTLAAVVGSTGLAFFWWSAMRDGRVALIASTNVLYVFDPVTNTLTTKGSIGITYIRGVLTLADGTLAIFGTGYVRGWNPDTEEFSNISTTPLSMNYYAFPTLLPDGRVFLAAAAATNFVVFDPRTGVVTALLPAVSGNTPKSRGLHLLPDGSLLSLCAAGSTNSWRIRPSPKWSFEPGAGAGWKSSLLAGGFYS